MIETLHKHTGWWLFAAAIVVTAAVYASGLSGGWIFDDYPNIVNNPGIQIHQVSVSSLARAALSSPSSRFHRPLASITFAFNYLFAGLNPYSWKVTNVVIHLVNGLLTFLLVRLLLRLGLPAIRREGMVAAADERYIGILAAIIAGSWMLLPINLTAVLYVVQRMASLADVFVLLGLIGYVVGRMHMLDGARRRGRAFVLCVASLVVCTGIGFTAKETAIMLPLYAFLVECILFRFRARTPVATSPDTTAGRRKHDKLVIGLFVVVLLLPCIAGLVWLAPRIFSPETFARRDFTLDTRLLSEARIVCDYIVWTILPTPDALSFYHDGYVASANLFTPWTTLPCILVIAALIALAIWLHKRAPLASLGLLLFFGSLSLTSTVLPLELVFEHRNYFASLGLMLALIPVLAALPYGKVAGSVLKTANRLPLASLRYVVLVALLLLWTVQTAITAYAWGNPLLLAQTLAARAPDSPRAQYSLGRTYIVKSHYNPHSIYTQAAYAPLERAAALPGSSILPQQALIFMNARMHRPIKASWWNSMIAKLKARPPGVQDISSLAALTKCAREGGCQLPEQRMVAAFQAALSHPDPEARLLSIYGDYAWNVLDNHSLGEDMVARAVHKDPGEPAYHITLTRMLVGQGRLQDARRQIQALEKLNDGGRLDGSIAGLRSRVAGASTR